MPNRIALDWPGALSCLRRWFHWLAARDGLQRDGAVGFSDAVDYV